MKTIKNISCNSSCKEIYTTLRTRYDEFADLVFLINKYPILAKAVLNVAKRNGKVDCTFPFMCNHFPCKTLSCHYDNLSNDGIPWRRT